MDGGLHRQGREGPPGDILIVSQDLVRSLLPLERCIDVVAEALAELSAGDSWMPLRSILDLPVAQGAVFGFMPAALGGQGIFGVKVTSVFPANEGSPYQSHQGAYLLFEASHGRLLAVLDGSELTALRTPAASAAATRVLAREDAGHLALIGSGVQAAGHLRAMSLVRRLRSVRVWSMPREDAERFAREHGPACEVAIEVVGTAREALRGADLVCTTTPAAEPVVLGEWLEPGAHVNAVGFSGPAGRELDAEAVARSRLFVDRRESTMHEAGEFLLGIEEGAFGPEHIEAELGEVLLGRSEGRRSDADVTMFRSLGVAVEDLAAAAYVYRRAREEGVGTSARLGGLR